MAERDFDIGSWDWHEDAFKLEYYVPQGISRSLWDEFISSDAESQSIFLSTSAAENTDSDPALHSFDSQDSSGNFSSELPIEEDNLSYKRRRMLFSDYCGAPSDASETVPEQTSSLETSMINATDCLTMGSPVSSSPLWCDDNNVASSLADEWFSNAIHETSSEQCREMMKMVVPVKQITGLWKTSEEEVLQGPQTPHSSRPPTPGSKASAVKTCRVSTPIAYPFALVKPSEAEGDITLKDINQRISKTPSKGSAELNEDLSRSPAELGVGLSGKSIVTLTKIHTEGHGTITIMRTKG